MIRGGVTVFQPRVPNGIEVLALPDHAEAHAFLLRQGAAIAWLAKVTLIVLEPRS